MNGIQCKNVRQIMLKSKIQHIGNFLVEKFFLAKSRQTRIRLRGNTFGDSQSSKNLTYTSPNNLEYLPLENKRKVSPNLNDN